MRERKSGTLQRSERERRIFAFESIGTETPGTGIDEHRWGFRMVVVSTVTSHRMHNLSLLKTSQ